MMNLLNRLFRPFSVIRHLEAENIELKAKLLMAQENLNKTNSYWKKRLYHAKNPKAV